jgi:hypothetical protein
VNRTFIWLASVSLAVLAGHEAARETAPVAQTREVTTEHDRRARAAMALCREAYGPDALIEWISDHAHVCRRGSKT